MRLVNPITKDIEETDTPSRAVELRGRGYVLEQTAPKPAKRARPSTARRTAKAPAKKAAAPAEQPAKAAPEHTAHADAPATTTK